MRLSTRFPSAMVKSAQLETIDVVKQCKQEGVSREECLRRLSRLHGVYVPSLYRAEYHADGTLASFEPTEEGVPRTVV